ncbi:MAG: hypothetical protein IPL26_10095 [Leptospiraceae bacterium]|nr:hypothetical protein [Leptospiraceae bacterium]
MKKILPQLLIFLILLFVVTKCSDSWGSYKSACYADNGCNDAFASCYITFVLVVPNKDQLNSLCAFRAYSCQKFCEKCEKYLGSPGHAPCFTNQYKPFFGLSDGKEKQ